jgi:hypothetical protein
MLAGHFASYLGIMLEVNIPSTVEESSELISGVLLCHFPDEWNHWPSSGRSYFPGAGFTVDG